jgi:hypothetical protein
LSRLESRRLAPTSANPTVHLVQSWSIARRTAEAEERAKRHRGSGAFGMAGADDDISRQASRRKAGEGTVCGYGRIARANNGMGLSCKESEVQHAPKLD